MPDSPIRNPAASVAEPILAATLTIGPAKTRRNRHSREFFMARCATREG
jgi:hypothetical protein